MEQLQAIRVLLVEDNADVARTIGRLLRRHVREVVLATDVAAAVVALAHAPFDLVVSDLKLHSESALDVLEAMATSGVSAPFVLITGSMDTDVEDRVLRDPRVRTVLRKPFDSEALLTCLARVLDGHG